MSVFLNKIIITELLRTKSSGVLYHRESQTLEFKESFNFSGLAEYLRDFAAFANNKGGYLIFGIKDRPKREIIGLKESAIDQLNKLDPEKISGHILNCFSINITWEHEIYEINDFTIGAFYVHKGDLKPVICKVDYGRDQELKNGEIYYRYGGRTQKIQSGELESIINKRIEQNNIHWQNLVQRIGTAGPSNVAILDTERGILQKGASQTLMIDESLLEKIKWIREGCFSEKNGEKTLKVVGDVTPMNTIDVVHKVLQDKLKEYPLSATELKDQILQKSSGIKINDIWLIIKENSIKENSEYSTYNYRNLKQEKKHKESGELPAGIPSIYKKSAVDFIIKLYENACV